MGRQRWVIRLRDRVDRRAGRRKLALDPTPVGWERFRPAGWYDRQGERLPVVAYSLETAAAALIIEAGGVPPDLP